MRSMRTVLLILIAMTAVAAADGYACPHVDGIDVCPHETMVPEGCPVHILLGHDVVPADLRATVTRGPQMVDVTGTVTTTPITHNVGTKDYYSCDCHEITEARKFDIYAVPLVGVVAGEQVTVSAPAWASATIGPAGPCPAFTYSTNFYDPIACDLCPPTHGDDPGANDARGGCMVTGSGSLLVGLALLLLTRSHARVSRRRVRNPYR